MFQRKNYAVNGFYPCPVPVSLSDQAALFARGRDLYRADAGKQIQKRSFSGEITQVVQTSGGIYVLEWTDQGEAVLRKLDGGLQTVSRWGLFQGGPAQLDRPPDPFDLDDWRNQKEFCLLTEKWVFRLSFQPDEEDPAQTLALVLDCLPLEEGEPVRYTFGKPEIDGGLMGSTDFHYLDIRVGLTQLWACQNHLFLNVSMYDGSVPGPRYLLLRLGADGSIGALRDAQDSRAGHACFFDFGRDIMWTCIQPEEAACPEDATGSSRLLLAARRIAPDALVLPQYPVWKGVEWFQDYFDGAHAFAVRDGLWCGAPDGEWLAARSLPGTASFPLVLWRDSLVLDLDGAGPQLVPLEAVRKALAPPEEEEAD